MSEPRRWIDDPATSDQLRCALRSYPRTTAIPAEALLALGAALGHAALGAASSTVPITAAAAPVAPVGAASASAAGAASATAGGSVGIATTGVSSVVSATATGSMGVAAITKIGLVAMAIGAGGAGWSVVASRTDRAESAGAVSLVAISSSSQQSRHRNATLSASAVSAAVKEESESDLLRTAGHNDEAPTARISSDASSIGSSELETAGVERSQSARNESDRTRQRTLRNGSQESQLQREAAILEQARRALPQDPKLTLLHTAIHRERFKNAILGYERDLLEMDAFCRLGNQVRAERIFDAMLKVQPVGPYAERARRILAGASREESSAGVKEHKSFGNH